VQHPLVAAACTDSLNKNSKPMQARLGQGAASSLPLLLPNHEQPQIQEAHTRSVRFACKFSLRILRLSDRMHHTHTGLARHHTSVSQGFLQIATEEKIT